MCWTDRRKTAAKEHRCERCAGAIAIGEKYVVMAHVPDGRCEQHSTEWSVEYECGEDRFKVVKLCGPCANGGVRQTSVGAAMTKKQKLAIQKAEGALTAIRQRKDIDQEQDHIDADEVLLVLLVELGCEKVVATFNSIDKWYA